MKVLVIEPSKSPEVRNVGSSLESMQKLVGGYVQALPFLPEADALVDEEGLFKPYVVNNMATAILKHYLALQGRLMLPGDAIKNTMVIAGNKVDKEGEVVWADTPQTVIDDVMRLAKEWAADPEFLTRRKS